MQAPTDKKHQNKTKSDGKSGQKPVIRKRKKITLRYLENAGLHYLNRFSSSRSNFEKIMRRKINKSCKDHPDQDLAICLNMLTEITDKFERLGYLNDSKFAEQLTRSLFQQGKSPRLVAEKLREKGLSNDIITQHVSKDHNAPADLNYLTALRFCQKKRLGAFSNHLNDNDEDQNNPLNSKEYQKTMGKFARAGFDYATAKKALATPIAEAEDLISYLQQIS